MLAQLNRIKERRLNGEKGFTLTELLVVIVIIGILVAIAIPVFLSQREAAFAKAAESDVRNAIPALETYYANENAYPTATFTETGEGIATQVHTAPDGVTVNVSDGVTLVYTYVAAAAGVGSNYKLVATHKELGADKTWEYTSVDSKFTFED